MPANSCRAASTRPAWLQPARTPRKVTPSGRTPASRISRKYSRECSPWPCMPSPTMRAFQVKTFFSGLRRKTITAAFMRPHLAYMSTRAVVRKTPLGLPLRRRFSM
ncbi:unnamed protein product [Spirodela intermedia]|uniref:Uncharacterized protein n=2 Tax=Spirodela intermedia TaxID=51605 RepID=A0A7I8J1Y0_SPIIN|nr:unnamed protein product [Spirodela intermedia]CAA6664158.1 unnamed protein product [Spirodela intermedia]CAA7400696.1 unnamed protein product [Spirodela intermedia]